MSTGPSGPNRTQCARMALTTLLVAREGHYDAAVAQLIVIWLFTIILAPALLQEWVRLRRRKRELADPQTYTNRS